jgi:hypothetical protein
MMGLEAPDEMTGETLIIDNWEWTIDNLKDINKI